MKTTRMPGLQLCRSHASTAACVPGEPSSAIVPRRADRTKTSLDHAKLVDIKYKRLVDSRRPPQGDRRRAVTLAMLAKNEKEPPKMKTKPKNRTLVDHARTVPPPPPNTDDHVFQVVVMRVSIHCQGCAGKVKKHISKMEGVTSFSIDLDSKRVTVMGHVSPVGVLESISKVKKAEFWTSR